MIGKNPKRDFSLLLRDWYRRDFKLLWEEESDLRFNCKNNKRIWFLRHNCEYNGYCDYKPTDFNLAVAESDFPFEYNGWHIFSNKYFDKREFYNTNEKSIFTVTSQKDTMRVKSHCNAENVTLTLCIKIFK